MKINTIIQIKGKKHPLKMWVPQSNADLEADFVTLVWKIFVFGPLPSFESAVLTAVLHRNITMNINNFNTLYKNLSEEDRRNIILKLSNLLSWLFSSPTPLYLDLIKGVRGVEIDFSDVSLGKWIKMQSLHKALLNLHKTETYNSDKVICLCREFVGCFFPSKNMDKFYELWQFYMCMECLRKNEAVFARKFPNLFKDVSGLSPEQAASSFSETAKNMLRNLTGGDVTKNEAVLNTPVYDCFMELDERIKEQHTAAGLQN